MTKAANTEVVSQKSVMEQLEVLTDARIKQSKKITELSGNMRSANARMKRVETRLGKIEPHKVEKYLSTIEDYAKSIGEQYRALHLKMTVAAAIGFVGDLSRGFDVSACALQVIRCFDEPDQWWMDRQDWEIGEWIAEMERRNQSR